MNKYITLNSSKGLDYQIISRRGVNQTFYWRPLFPDMIYEFEFGLSFRSDFNYQLAIL